MATIQPLPASRLHATYDPALVPADDSDGIRPAPAEGRTPFQDRAMKALDLAVNIQASGFNVYLAGDTQLGRMHLLRQYLQPLAKKSATPPDLVYVYNFQDPDCPVLVPFPSGQGSKFRKAMEDCVEEIGATLERRVGGQRFIKQREKLLEAYQNERTQLLHRMNSVAEHKGFNIDVDDAGSITLYPLVKGRRVSEDEFEGLDASLRLALKHRSEAVAQHMSGLVHELAKMEEGYAGKEKDLERGIMAAVLDAVLEPVAKRSLKACQAPALETYFKDLREDLLKNTDAFLNKGGDLPAAQDPRAAGQPQMAPDRPDVRARLRVNLFVDNQGLKGAPIVVEDHPTPANLLGCIERESELGALVTDFTLVKAGSLHRANGGFLVLHMDDLLHHPAAWEGLLRALKAGVSRLEDNQDLPDAAVRTKGLKPAPVKLELKVVLIGDEYIYEGLLDSDERFAKLFRIKAEMADRMPRSAAGVRYYLGAIRRIVDLEGLPPFDRTAMAWLVDLGSNLCDDQKRLSLKFPILREHMIEAAALAKMQGLAKVTGAVLEESYAQRDYRSSLVEELYMEEYDRDTIKVETQGQAIGQVNGLAVTTYGTFEFGLPHRISCTVGVGHDGIIDLERESDLGGPIHTKAMMILVSYLTGMFASKKPLMLSASLFFEQSYAGIEGDSASGAELAALLSALAEVPVRLDLAFTGAVSHSGQIMAVGGVTQKIEGFFKVCQRQRLTGTQGVIIPYDNIDQLMLSPTVLKAVDEGQFAIYPVRRIEDALQLLTGMQAGRRRRNGSFTKGTLYDLVDRRLERLGEYGQNAFRRQRKP
ncbi:MAG: AAA family ATPase [Desulfovibrio sp.]|nr:AAA family ATPase [Desulfovibrio sp.]